MLALLAQADGSGSLPQGKAIAMILFFGAVTVISLVGLFASKKSLESMAGIIGTKNPMVARIVCGLGFLVGAGAVFVTTLSLLGKL
jgi:hypothetical protein